MTTPPTADPDLPEALAKRAAGEKLTTRERATLRRHDRAQEEELRWKFYASIPQKHWRKLSGRQPKVLTDQAQRYGIPFAGRSIDLGAVARAMHDFLAQHAAVLGRAIRRGGGDPGDPGDDSETDWLEEYRRERALMARLERQAAEARYLPRAEVHTAFGRIAGLLRRAGDLLERHAGSEARQILQEALDNADREIDRLCVGGGPDAMDPDDAPTGRPRDRQEDQPDDGG
jgi:hypothetical protein